MKKALVLSLTILASISQANDKTIEKKESALCSGFNSRGQTSLFFQAPTYYTGKKVHSFDFNYSVYFNERPVIYSRKDDNYVGSRLSLKQTPFVSFKEWKESCIAGDPALYSSNPQSVCTNFEYKSIKSAHERSFTVSAFEVERNSSEYPDHLVYDAQLKESLSNTSRVLVSFVKDEVKYEEYTSSWVETQKKSSAKRAIDTVFLPAETKTLYTKLTYRDYKESDYYTVTADYGLKQLDGSIVGIGNYWTRGCSLK